MPLGRSFYVGMKIWGILTEEVKIMRQVVADAKSCGILIEEIYKTTTMRARNGTSTNYPNKTNLI